MLAQQTSWPSASWGCALSPEGGHLISIAEPELPEEVPAADLAVGADAAGAQSCICSVAGSAMMDRGLKKQFHMITLQKDSFLVRPSVDKNKVLLLTPTSSPNTEHLHSYPQELCFTLVIRNKSLCEFITKQSILS